MATPTIKAVLFDAAGVLTGPFSAELVSHALEAGADAQVLLDVVYPLFATEGPGDSMGNRLERGEVSLEAFFASLGDHEPHVRLVLDPAEPTFFGHGWAGNDDMQAFVAEVRAHGFATAMVSNNVREWQDTWDRVVPPTVPFDARLFSWQVGARKPEAAMYEAALTALDIEPAEALFLDDFPAMADGARRLGISAIDVTDTQTAIDEARAILSI